MKPFLSAAKFSYLFFIMTLAATSAISQRDTAIEHLKNEINDLLASQKGVFAVAFKDISSGKELLINEKEIFHAASTMKTPVLIEVYRQAKKKKFSLEDSLVIKNEFHSIVDSSTFSLDSTDDSELELYRQIGQKKKIYDLVYKMIIESSNLATNIIIELVGAKNVTRTMRKWNANDIQVLRGVEDNKAFQKGMNNVTTAFDLMLIFQKIAKGKAVSKKASKEMIKILLDQKFNTIIPAQLPKDVKVAHKTGFITALHHDSGIVFLPDGRKYVLVLLSKKLEDEKQAVQAMATVSFKIYQYMLSH